MLSQRNLEQLQPDAFQKWRLHHEWRSTTYRPIVKHIQIDYKIYLNAVLQTDTIL
jgi:hypothetical protein